MKIIMIISSVILALFLGTIIFLTVRLQFVINERDLFRTQLHECITAPITTQTTVVPVLVTNNKPVSPIPLSKPRTQTIVSANEPVHYPVQPVSASDTTIKESSYAETYDIGDSIHISWSAHTLGRIDWFNIDSLKYPSRTTTITKTVQAPSVITKEKSHLWLYGKPQANLAPFKVTGISGGLIWTVRGKWGVGAGIGYEWKYNTPMVEASLLFNLK